MRLCRRLFVVPLANNDHGKTTMIRALVSQGMGWEIDKLQKGVRKMTTPFGRPVDAYVYGRSYQETERDTYGSVENSLNQSDPAWRTRELIIMPSHVASQDYGDIKKMIWLAHNAGFDIVAASIILTRDSGDNRAFFPKIWKLNWDERWTIPNPWSSDPTGQLEALGRDLWVWISNSLVK
ncbi:hypothetical protein ASD54_25315 [Rhizobium sp. Root149]|uniref:hypothetical protein n=1 Tax=Rhizobium sp. Root149 TaxID=1736473 RepID=UPI00071400B9|nr:hypothetical protein [Rhizobium sp. Root149]KQZ56264.1 hypothetical protein ASD54_25315 [Rhizobium sp. Root149]